LPLRELLLDKLWKVRSGDDEAANSACSVSSCEDAISESS
jgi:hypothetical protein